MFGLKNLTRLAIAVFLLIGILIISCNKAEDPKIDFNINGLADVTLDENGSVVKNLTIEHLNGPAEQVTLTIDGLPDGISASFNISTGQPPFDATLYIKDDSSKGDIYEVNVLARSASGIEHAYPFKITTLQKTCTKKASGLYEGTSTCRDGQGQIYNYINFEEDSVSKDRLYFVWQQNPLYVDVNCNTKQLTMPLQTSGDHKISGDGYLTENYTVIRLNYIEWDNNGDSISCFAIFKKR